MESRPQTVHCFLSPQTESDRLLLTLNASVVLQPVHSQAPSLNELRIILINRYGGAPENWRIRCVYSAFLIKVPDWMFFDDFSIDELFWASQHIEVLPWQTLDSSQASPPSQRVTIKIVHFPLEHWHPFYFRQATSAMGTLMALSPEVTTGGNMATARLLIQTHDLGLIPPSITLHHRNKTTVCQVLIDEAPEPHPHPPPGPPPGSPPPSREREQHEEIGTRLANPGNHPLYIPPWRREIIRQRVSNPDPDRRAPPAAQIRAFGVRSREGEYEPIPSQISPFPQHHTINHPHARSTINPARPVEINPHCQPWSRNPLGAPSAGTLKGHNIKSQLPFSKRIHHPWKPHPQNRQISGADFCYNRPVSPQKK